MQNRLNSRLMVREAIVAALLNGIIPWCFRSGLLERIGLFQLLLLGYILTWDIGAENYKNINISDELQVVVSCSVWECYHHLHHISRHEKNHVRGPHDASHLPRIRVYIYIDSPCRGAKRFSPGVLTNLGYWRSHAAYDCQVTWTGNFLILLS